MADEARVSQAPVEAVVQPDGQHARVSQEPVEAVVQPDGQHARVSQEPVEVVISLTAVGGGERFYAVVIS